MKVKIAVLFISVCQAIREILLAELLKDFLLVFRLKTAQQKVVFAELRTHAFIEGFSRTKKSLFIFVVVHLVLPFHGSNCIRAW
jgi:fatty-acid desaturase